jgi:protein-tyrosine phosphatase
LIPLVDTHCHLLAGLDDGPQTDDEALRMCEDALEEGVQMIAAVAHQNPYYPTVTPERIRAATQKLADQLRAQQLPLTVFPCAEVMLQPDTELAWARGRLLSVADRRQYLLVEMPHGQFVNLAQTAARLRSQGVRPIIAHAERYPELLHGAGLVEEWIAVGCLVQVSSAGLTHAPGVERRALRSWFKRGVVHLLGSDGHNLDRRPPHMAAAYRQIVQWVGEPAADRICSTNGRAILQGLPIRISPPRPAGWLAHFW